MMFDDDVEEDFNASNYTGLQEHLRKNKSHGEHLIKKNGIKKNEI